MNEIKLVLPHIKYKDSFLSAIPEFKALAEPIHPQDTTFVKINENMSYNEFLDYVNSELETVKPGRSRKFTYWIIDKDGFAGSLRIRPDITVEQAQDFGHIGYGIRPSKRKKGYAKQALLLAIEISKKFGLDEVCVTCYDNNIASKKTIISACNEYGGRGSNTIGNDYYCWINTTK